MRNRYLTFLFVVGLSATSRGQLYVTSGNTLTIETGATVHSTGNVVNNGTVSGGGFLNLRSSATTYSGVGAISNLRLSGGANVTPANDVTIGNALDVAAGSSLTIPSGRYILVNGPLSNAGTFNVQNNGSLVQTSASVLTNSGTFHVWRQGHSSAFKYNYWSSPVTLASNVSVPGNPSSVYAWNPSASTQAYDNDAFDSGWSLFSGYMEPGVGYASIGGGLASFSGTVNNGDVHHTLFTCPWSLTHPLGTPYNLVGNPYPCSISALDLISENGNINGAIYFWDNPNDFSGFTTNDYAVWNPLGSVSPSPPNAGGGGNAPNGFIASGQGFMVRATANTDLVFNNDMRVTGPNNQFFKFESEPSRMWLSISGATHYKEILIGLIDDATDGEDRLYDAGNIRGNQSLSLAAVNEGHDYCIIGFPPPLADKTIPLSVFIGQSGEYTFEAHTVEGYEGYDLYLEDRSNMSYYTITEGTPISSFQLNAGEIVDRFYLHIGPELVTDVDNSSSESSMRAWIYDGLLNVNLRNVSDAKRLELFDISGKMVWSMGSAMADRLTIDVNHLSRGAYILRLTSDSGLYSEKVLR